MDTNLKKEVRLILESFGEKYIIEGSLNKSKIIQDIDSYNQELIGKMMKNPTIKYNFTTVIDGNYIIQLNKIKDFFELEQYWYDSYTKYSKKIGLTVNNHFIDETNEIVLTFPYKDTVLKASMSKEDTDEDDLLPNEPFLNEVIAKEEIDILLDNKIYIDVKKYNDEGVQNVSEFSDKDNLIILGNNLVNLYSIKNKYSEKVKLIYLDVPYYFPKKINGDTFKYNSNFKLSTWLTFMKNRLEVAKDLLNNEGSIFIHSNDESQPYLKVLCDSIFGAENFLNTIAVNMKNIAGASGGGEDKKFKKNVEYISVYAKNIDTLPPFNSLYSYDELYETVEKYKEEGISWKYTSVLYYEGDKKYIGSTKTGNGEEIKIFERKNPIFKSVSRLASEENCTEQEIYYKYINKIHQTAMPQSSIRNRVMDKVKELDSEETFYSIEYTPRSGRFKGTNYEQFYKGKNFRLLAWLKDVVIEKDKKLFKSNLLGTYWDYVSETKNLSKEGQVTLNNGKKPEKLLEHIIECSTQKGDIVLDFFLGSGTTAAVAHKMERQYIGIEQIDYEKNSAVERLKNVIHGEQNGISSDLSWGGGGSFVYMKLFEKNRGLIKGIKEAENQSNLLDIFNFMIETAEIDFRVDLLKAKEFLHQLSLKDQKRALIKIIDKNQLYYNYSEIEDEAIREILSESDYSFNKSFYEDEVGKIEKKKNN